MFVTLSGKSSGVKYPSALRGQALTSQPWLKTQQRCNELQSAVSLQHVMTSPFLASHFCTLPSSSPSQKIISNIQAKTSGMSLEDWVRNPRMTFSKTSRKRNGLSTVPSAISLTRRWAEEGQCAKNNPMEANFQMWNSLLLLEYLCIKKKNPKRKTFHFDQNYSRIQFKLHQHKLLLKILNWNTLSNCSLYFYQESLQIWTS